MKPDRHEHQGHHIELREQEGKRALVIDNVPVEYGQLPSGKYFLREYAFDWSDDLIEVAQRFIEHRLRAEKIQEQSSARKRGK